MSKDMIDEIKLIVESPEGQESIKEVQDTMDKNKCTFIEACNILAQEILDE